MRNPIEYPHKEPAPLIIALNMDWKEKEFLNWLTAGHMEFKNDFFENADRAYKEEAENDL